MALRSSLGAALCIVLVGCSDSAEPEDDGGGGRGGAGATGPEGCTEPTTVACSDQAIQTLNLQDDVPQVAITNEPDGEGFLALVDATAGGDPFDPDPTAYTYGKFTDTGLVKVDINDEDALDSMDWDIAFRRYIVRINSGHSGPSCVLAVRMPPETNYDTTTGVPPELTYRKDEMFTDSCELIPDGSGLENSPATALSSFWTYPGCVQMTGNVFVLALADGRQLKLTITDYYLPEYQDMCDENGSVPMVETGAGNYRVRWAFLP
jgi:hypothetical protein